jgi:hypothetical protein
MHHLIHFVFGISAFFVLFLVLLTAISAYFLPTILAFLTHHQRRWLLAALNLFLGWSFIAWFVCMIWVWSGPRGRASDPMYFG